MIFGFRIKNRRAVLISAAVLAQLFAVVLIFSLAARRFVVIKAAMRLVTTVTALYIFSREMPPDYKLSWLMLLTLFPDFGAVIYLIGGKMGLPRFFRRNTAAADKAFLPAEYRPSLLPKEDNFAPISVFLTRYADMPPCQNTECEFFPSGEKLFDRLCEKLEGAERFIFMEYFIISQGALWNRIEKILTEKSRRGVMVLLLYDDVGSMNTLPRDFARRLNSKGIKALPFNRCRPHLNSAMNYRDHRKITVIDGNIGFCGGANIADEYINRLPRCSHWKDSGTMLRGEGVFNLTVLFLQLWNSTAEAALSPTDFAPTEKCVSDGVIQPFGDNPLDDLYIAESVCAMSIARAKSYIYITTPYLILDSDTVSALCRAAMSGIDVRIITPAVPDKRCIHLVSQGSYPFLLRHGVRIFEYSPGFIHSKQLVTDDSFAMVGTANMDHRSFFLHYEAAVCLFNCRAVEQVRLDIEATLSSCREITCGASEKLSLPKKLFRLILRLFSPLF